MPAVLRADVPRVPGPLVAPGSVRATVPRLPDVVEQDPTAGVVHRGGGRLAEAAEPLRGLVAPAGELEKVRYRDVLPLARRRDVQEVRLQDAGAEVGGHAARPRRAVFRRACRAACLPRLNSC